MVSIPVSIDGGWPEWPVKVLYPDGLVWFCRFETLEVVFRSDLYLGVLPNMMDPSLGLWFGLFTGLKCVSFRHVPFDVDEIERR